MSCPKVQQHANLNSSILFTNFCSLLNKQDVLLDNVAMCESSIILGTETWLSADISDDELIDPTFVTFRKDRMCKKGGGALVAVKCLLPPIATDIVSNLEIPFVDIKMAHMNLVIGICYRSPNFGRHFVSSLAAWLDQVFSSPLFQLSWN